jgi:hypothetical protein
MALHPIFADIFDNLLPATKTVTPDVPGITCRGWAVTWDYGYYTATSPDYDASYEGPEDGWVDNGLRVTGRTLDDLHSEVDGWFEDNGQFGVGA